MDQFLYVLKFNWNYDNHTLNVCQNHDNMPSPCFGNNSYQSTSPIPLSASYLHHRDVAWSSNYLARLWFFKKTQYPKWCHSSVNSKFNSTAHSYRVVLAFPLSLCHSLILCSNKKLGVGWSSLWDCPYEHRYIIKVLMLRLLWCLYCQFWPVTSYPLPSLIAALSSQIFPGLTVQSVCLIVVWPQSGFSCIAAVFLLSAPFFSNQLP